jgi:trehalose 6-phosphate synthase
MHQAYEAYKTVNRRVADAVIAEAQSDSPPDAILIQDYHLYLVPGMVREACPDATIQFFLHIPWPDPGAWRCLPIEWMREFLHSVAACDLVGLQTSPDADAFRRSCKDHLGLEVDTPRNLVRSGYHTTVVRHYPISLAVDEFEELARSSGVRRVRENVREARPQADDGMLIVRVDRTDPSKNIVRGMLAFGLLLHEHPELHGRVAMYCQLDPSRQDIPEYVGYKDEIITAAEGVNHAYGYGGWQPVVLNLDASFQAAVAAYQEYDVLFVNPVADGMNLVSKEGPVVNERAGVLVLSEQAGSYRELGAHAVSVNPFDIAEQADALYTALNMLPDERAARASALREQVVQHDVRKWMNDQLRDLFRVRDEREADRVR